MNVHFDESSRQSQRSTTVSTVSSEAIVDSSTHTPLDYLFPLYDEVTRVAPEKVYSSLIIFFVIIFEALINGYFPMMPEFWDYDKNPDKILRYFAYLLDFGNGDKSICENYIPTIIVVCLTFLIFFWFMGILTYYRANKTFNRKTIFISRFIFSYNIPVLLIPVMFCFGFNLNAIFETESNKGAFIALAVLSAYSAINMYSIFYLDVIFRSSTSYIEHSCYSMWNGEPFFFFFFSQGLAAFASRLLYHFPIWTRYFLIAMYVVTSIFLLLTTFYFPYILNKVNTTMASVHVTNAVSAIFSALPIHPTIRLVIPIPVFFISIIVFNIVFKKLREKIIANPQTKGDHKALRSLRVCIANDPSNFVDWSLLRAIAKENASTKILVRIAQILSFFPSESQLLNHFVLMISKHSDMDLSERFLFYQIRRVHVLRQSSATKQFNFEFEEVKKSTSKMIANFSQFFVSNNDYSIGTLVGLVKLNRQAQGICLESLEKYPNSSRLAYEYSKYLIECHAQFKEGVVWHYKAELMDSGRHTSIDYSFRAMINLFPVYLKKNILDYKGKRITHIKNGKMSNSSNSSMSNRNVELDDEANEEQADKVFDKPRLRFALKRAVDNMKCRPLDFLLENTITCFVLTFFVFLALYIGFHNFFKGRLDNTILLDSVATIREVLSIGMASFCQLIGQAFHVISQIYYPEETAEYDVFKDPIAAMLLSTMNGITASQTLSELIASHGSSIVETAQYYLLRGNMSYCLDNGTLLPPIPMSSRALSYYMLMQFPKGGSTIQLGVHHTSIICELIANAGEIEHGLDLQTVQFTSRESSTADNINKQLDLAFILVPIAIVIIAIIPLIINIVCLLKHIKKVFSATTMLPKDVIVQASKPIYKSSIESSTVASSIENDRWPLFGVPIVTVLSMLITILAIVLYLLKIRNSNNHFMNAALWLETSARRGPLVTEALTNIYFMCFFQAVGDQSYGSIVEYMSKTREFLDLVMQLNRDLLLGNDRMPPCNGFSDALDELHFQSSCDVEVSEEGLHGNYNCLSIDQMMMVFSSLAEDVLANFQENPYSIIGLTPTFLQLSHLVFYHLFPNLRRIQAILSEDCDNLIDQTNKYNLVLLIVCFVVIAILFIINLFLIAKLRQAYNTLKILIARFPPNGVISNQNLLDIILGKHREKRTKQISAHQSVIDSSPDAIFGLSGDCTIESMNPAAARIFGYAPEQILGQSLTTLIPNTDENKTNSANASTSNEKSINGQKESLYRQFQLMKANQTAMTYSCQAVGLKDDDSEVNLEVTLIGINEGQYFALIANDQTIKIRQQKEVEEAKRQSEKLLYQILPRDIVTRMNRGEKDISFTVQSATIIFIDVVKFSDYMATLQSKQVLENLGKYFKNWDDLLQKYKTIIKIKLIGDVYMAAAGLFNQELPPSTHAIEMLNYAIDGVRALDDINHQLDANLSVRIGINTGGPIIAGVLGTDKPLFDIIGDAINVSSRLQSTDIPNNIQISQPTYDLVKDKNFDIEQRGEIMLKGKGAQMVYLVHPTISEISSQMNTGSVFRLPRFSSVASINGLPTIGPQQTVPSMDGIPEEEKVNQEDQSILTNPNDESILSKNDNQAASNSVPDDNAISQSDVSQSEYDEGSIKIDMDPNSEEK